MGMEDLTLKEIQEAMELLIPISESIVKHALVILGDPDHECAADKADLGDLPAFTDGDIKAYLAYEESALEQFKFMRRAFIEFGYTELSDEVV